MRGHKITEEQYKRVKKQLRWHKPDWVARSNELSIEKVMKIEVSRDYNNFEAITRAEHPPQNESSLGRRVTRLEQEAVNLRKHLYAIGAIPAEEV